MPGNPTRGRGNKTGRRVGKIAQTRERLDVVDQMLRQGYTTSSIQVLLGKKWDLTRRQIRNYIMRVRKEWDKERVKATEDRIVQRRAQIEGAIEMALRRDPPNFKAAMQGYGLLCRIDGCFPADEVNVGVAAQVGIGMGLSAMGFTSAEDVRARLDELQARLLNGGPIAAGYLEGTGHEEAPTGSGRPKNGHARGGNGSAESN